MAFARTVYVATAAQTDFTIDFAYLDEVDVLVYVDGVLQTSGASNDYTIVSSTICRFNSGMAGGEIVLLKRSTSQTTRLVDWATASNMVEEDMDNDSLQAFYMAQESIDVANNSAVLQIVETVTGAVATGTTVLPEDDTIPQSTEGNELMTLAFTPQNADSRLLIEAQAHLSHTADTDMAIALFKDADANALAVGFATSSGVACPKLMYEMASPGTSTYTFKIRGGCADAGTLTFNGAGGSRKYGGTLSSFIKITEFIA